MVSLLIFIGREINLIQSVPMTILLYARQSTKLPRVVCDEAEKKSRAFLWGNNSLQHKPSLIKWEAVCLPREVSGLGLHDI